MLTYMASKAIINQDDIISRIKAGEKLTDIARHYGYKDHSAIVHRLKDHPEYQIARETGVEARMESREGELELAQDSVTVARARELLSHARWRAEREFPHRWGQKQQIITASVPVDQLLQGDALDLIRSMRDVTPKPSAINDLRDAEDSE